ncbi:hypothetical protein D9M72_137370 [compost metagenome]
MKQLELLVLALLAKAFPSLQPKVDKSKSVDNVLGSLKKAIDDLGVVQTAQQAEADRLAAKAIDANLRATAASEEAGRAAAAQKNIQSLIGV